MAALTPLLSSRGLAQTNDFDLRWGGNVFDVFTIDGNEAWTVEDGGRIRHRDPISGNWSFQNVPVEVKDTLHRIFFLPGTTGAQTGWAVAADGSILKTVNSGSVWTRVAQIPHGSSFEVLYAVHFVDSANGWVAGLHSIWYTEDGGSTWFPSTLKHADGSVYTSTELEEIELYELDAIPDPNPPPDFNYEAGTPILGLAAAEPGLVFRCKNGREWQVVWNICEHTHEVLGTCASGICTGHAEEDIWEPWDIEISRNPTQKLALLCGGIVFQCGLVWRSTDDGTTWVREEHECLPCAGVPCATCPANSYLDEVTPPPPFGQAQPDYTIYRFMRMRTIYSLDIIDEDNSALAVGYNGQVMWRNPSTQIWEDRSRFSNEYVTHPTPDLIHVSALFGVATNGIAGTGRVAFSTGVGGTLRRSTDGGLTWPPDLGTVKGQPYRAHDVDFGTAMDGWMVGQFSRIARTSTAATDWTEVAPLPDDKYPSLHAVTFADSQRGAAVGGNSGSSSDPWGSPRILYTRLGGTPWLSVHHTPANTQLVLSPNGIYGSLKDVTYVPGTSNIWAAGDKGFIVRANTDGESPWRQTLINGSQMGGFEINGVAFKDSSTGLFVGRDTTLGVALVYQLKINGGAFTWSSIQVNPISAPVVDLGDVAVFGSDAYVVGETLSSAPSIRKGIILKSTYNGSTFPPFQPFTPAQLFPKCEVGSNLRGGDEGGGPTVPVLNRIAIVDANDIWVGGECGRVWRYFSGAWTEYKSQTDTNLLGISFPSANDGFFVGYRYNETSQALVRYQ